MSAYQDDSKIVAITSQSSASTTQDSSPLIGLDRYSHVDVYALLVGATNGTLDVYIQTSYDGTTYFDVAHFAQLASGAAAIIYQATFPSVRVAAAPIVVGSNTTSALAAGAATGARLGRKTRIRTVSGVGTTAGAALSFHFIPTKF